MKPWRTLARDTVLTFGRYLTVERHTIQLPDGRVLTDWPWAIAPDFINVLPMLPDGRFLVFRQTKYAASGVTLALVGGMIEPDELPLTAARRELREEMGADAGEVIFLGKYVVDANRGLATGYLYLALDVEQRYPQSGDELEEQEILSLSRAELLSAYLSGQFQVMSWTANIGLALTYLNQS